MIITRAQVETLLLRRCGRRMAFVEFSQTVNGDNADLADPIATALIAMGVMPTDITAPADADFATLTDSQTPELLDRSELRLLQNILGNMDAVNISVDGRSEAYGQMTTSLEQVITRLQAKVNADYAGAGNTLSTGLIIQNFATKGDDVVL